MSASAFWLRINGYPATEIGPHSPPTIETLADGGIGEISWEFALSLRAQHQALKVNALVELMCGSMPIGTARMTEPDRSTWQCHAFGLSASLRKKAALDSGGNATRDLGAAIARVIANGWPGTNPTPVSGTAAGDPDANPITVGTLFDQYAEQTGQRWGVDGAGRLYMRPDPTTPTWLASPGSAAFGVTDEDVADTLIGRYDTGAGFATATVGTAGDEATVDLTDRGTLTLAAAEAILNGMIQRRGKVQWTNGVTLDKEQIMTMGGTPAFLPAVTGGRMIRALGIPTNAVTQGPWLDVVLGKTVWTVGSRSIYVEPVSTAPRGLADVIAAA